MVLEFARKLVQMTCNVHLLKNAAVMLFVAKRARIPLLVVLLLDYEAKCVLTRKMLHPW
jgi:hypothetical protein